MNAADVLAGAELGSILNDITSFETKALETSPYLFAAFKIAFSKRAKFYIPSSLIMDADIFLIYLCYDIQPNRLRELGR
jgi:hypothetical protein